MRIIGKKRSIFVFVLETFYINLKIAYLKSTKKFWMETKKKKYLQ